MQHDRKADPVTKGEEVRYVDVNQLDSGAGKLLSCSMGDRSHLVLQAAPQCGRDS